MANTFLAAPHFLNQKNAAWLRLAAMDYMQDTSELKTRLAPNRDRIGVPTLKTPEGKAAWKPETVRFSPSELRQIIADQID
jgi:hypothetical protein